MTAPAAGISGARPRPAAAGSAGDREVLAAAAALRPGPREFAALVSPAADRHLERLAAAARAITRRRFGRTISLFAPLYLSNHCPSGCAYCGFAADRTMVRRRLEPAELDEELAALKAMGFEEVLLLTGERSPRADFEYLRDCVLRAARSFHQVNVEAFPMTVAEYRELARAGCAGVSVYQETYDPAEYERLHRWGPKRDFDHRREAPARALEAGMRIVGLGVLLGLANPLPDVLRLYLHAVELRRRYWRSGISISFPRIRPEAGGFEPPHPVADRLLARIVFAFRICLPDVPLVLSTRERPELRDGMAGLGISKMSAASRTTVGGYAASRTAAGGGQFEVSDGRGVPEFCAALRRAGLEPVLKDWDAAYREEPCPPA